MTFALDPEIAAALAAAGDPAAPPAARGDWRANRAGREAVMVAREATLPELPEVERTDHSTRSYDGTEIGLRWFAPPGDGPGSAVVYLHGGGMILASVALYDRRVAAYVAESGVPFLAVDYRRAPEDPHPAPVEDCLAGVLWLHSHAAELGVDPDRIAVMGDSGGGGLAAATALLARERGVRLSGQVLIYPMLDDRNTTADPVLAPFARWNWDDNWTGWHALLGDAIGGPDVPATAAPARATDLSGLPPAYLEVGELDIFRDETLDYARRLADAGVRTEVHVHPGCPHAFENLAPDADVTRRSRADRLRVLRAL